ncbi:MAG: hypothetical protein ACI97B_003403 [Verrucomicrobiales bacterium]|jgi:hypothetical protein
MGLVDRSLRAFQLNFDWERFTYSRLLLRLWGRTNLNADPTETTDVRAIHPEIAAQLEARITAIVQTGLTRLGGKVPNDGPAWWNDLDWIPKP